MKEKVVSGWLIAFIREAPKAQLKTFLVLFLATFSLYGKIPLKEPELLHELRVNLEYIFYNEKFENNVKYDITANIVVLSSVEGGPILYIYDLNTASKPILIRYVRLWLHNTEVYDGILIQFKNRNGSSNDYEDFFIKREKEAETEKRGSP